ncbi:hypothetical protein D3C72_648250 [compost metagenome]
MVDFAAQHDDAARVRHAVAAALRIHARFRAAGHVQHGLLADPDGTVVDLALHDFQGLGHIHVTHAQLADIDLAARRRQGAQHGNLPHPAHLNRLPGVHVQLRTLPDDQRGIHIRAGRGKIAAALQRQAGALTLRYRSGGHIMLIDGRQPRLQHRRGVRARRQAGRALDSAVHRHRHIDTRAVGHRQAVGARELVARIALLKERCVQRQHALVDIAGRAPQHDLVSRHGQGAAAFHAIAAQLGAQA